MSAELDVKLQKVSDKCDRNEARIVRLEALHEALTELALSVQELAVNQANIKTDLIEIKKDVKLLSSIPATRWNSVTDKIITLLVGGFVAWLLTSGSPK